MEEQTISVSKGVFVFKNKFKPLPKHKRQKKYVSNIANKNAISESLWYKSYTKLWNIIDKKIEALNNEMFSSVLSDLLAFIKNSHNSSIIDEIPTAVLLTGINMPDHEAQFKALSKQIKKGCVASCSLPSQSRLSQY
ncbi:hypothetical protein NQ317_015914 [Molorchus minor]|uniref:Origin recognition complex subunit 3 N-terminal domain-containing protein n=1 Tax=Molorchus minor TaxID=1323400 RepID=A0ABQ9J3H4_9CUCU|nr:hypothetical protein NQ317_015914 [Molorchus minor]